MPIISEDRERDGILETAKLMLLSARTAPKSAGIDDIVLAVAYGKEKEEIVAEMMKIAAERNIEGFQRDACMQLSPHSPCSPFSTEYHTSFSVLSIVEEASISI